MSYGNNDMSYVSNNDRSLKRVIKVGERIRVGDKATSSIHVRFDDWWKMRILLANEKETHHQSR